MAGDGAEGLTGGGILENISQTFGNMSFLPDDEAWKFVDDNSFIEVVNVTMAGLANYNVRHPLPSDRAVGECFIPPENLKIQEHLNTFSAWAEKMEMKSNEAKSKYMTINYCSTVRFQTRLKLNDIPVEEVKSCRLLGVEI